MYFSSARNLINKVFLIEPRSFCQNDKQRNDHSASLVSMSSTCYRGRVFVNILIAVFAALLEVAALTSEVAEFHSLMAGSGKFPLPRVVLANGCRLPSVADLELRPAVFATRVTTSLRGNDSELTDCHIRDKFASADILFTDWIPVLSIRSAIRTRSRTRTPSAVRIPSFKAT